eukprot:3572278-Amphidinium_carterae.3
MLPCPGQQQCSSARTAAVTREMPFKHYCNPSAEAPGQWARSNCLLLAWIAQWIFSTFSSGSSR